MSITKHPAWPKLRKWFVIEPYTRDGGPNPRVRVWVRGVPDVERAFVEQVRSPCAHCGKMMQPIRRDSRSGRKSNGYYYAAACPQDDNLVCSRQKGPRLEYLLVKADVAPELLTDKDRTKLARNGVQV